MATNSSAVAAGVDSNFSSAVADASAGAESQSKEVKEFTEGNSDDDEKPAQDKPWAFAGEVRDESEPTRKLSLIHI